VDLVATQVAEVLHQHKPAVNPLGIGKKLTETNRHGRDEHISVLEFREEQGPFWMQG
jgi:hypothetical protein